MTSRAGHEPVLSCPGSDPPGFRKPVAVREILEFLFCNNGINIMRPLQNASTAERGASLRANFFAKLAERCSALRPDRAFCRGPIIHQRMDAAVFHVFLLRVNQPYV